LSYCHTAYQAAYTEVKNEASGSADISLDFNQFI